MSYINLDFEYLDHPKTKRLISMIGPIGEIMPVRAWLYCAKFHDQYGRFDGYSEKEIESCLDWTGKPGELIKAMLKVGFLKKESKGYRCHDWEEHQGHIYSIKIRNKAIAKNRWINYRKNRINGKTGEMLVQISDGKRNCTSGIP